MAKKSCVCQRIADVLKSEDIKSINSFSKTIGVPQQTLSNCVNGTSEPRVTVAEAILSGLPSLSAEWLMRGEGPMMRGASSPPPPEPLGGADDEVVRLRAENAVLREQLARTQEMLMGAIGGRKE